MDKLFVAVMSDGYEIHSILGVFTSTAKAEDAIKKTAEIMDHKIVSQEKRLYMAKNEHNDDYAYNIREYPLDTLSIW